MSKELTSVEKWVMKYMNYSLEDIKLNRINDGKTDPKGNLWFGTMDNLERKVEKGSLYKLDKYLNLTKVDQNYRITNGPAFIDEYNFYHTDSSKKIIYKIKCFYTVM